MERSHATSDEDFPERAVESTRPSGICRPAHLRWLSVPVRQSCNTPDFYIRKSSWHASLLASLEALALRGLEDGFESFESGTMRGGDPAQSIRIPLRAPTELYLFVTGVPDVRWAVADWADARIVRDDGSAEWVSQCRTGQRLVRPLRKGHHAQERPLPEIETQRPHLRARVECAGGQHHPCAVGGRVGMVRGKHRRGRLGRQQRYGAFQCAGGA